MSQSEQRDRELAEKMDAPRREAQKPLHGNAVDAKMEREAARDKRLYRHS